MDNKSRMFFLRKHQLVCSETKRYLYSLMDNIFFSFLVKRVPSTVKTEINKFIMKNYVLSFVGVLRLAKSFSVSIILSHRFVIEQKIKIYFYQDDIFLSIKCNKKRLITRLYTLLLPYYFFLFFFII